VDARDQAMATEAEQLYELIANGTNDDVLELASFEHDREEPVEVDVQTVAVELARRRSALDDGIPRYSPALPRTALPEPCTCTRCAIAAKLAIAGALIDPAGWLQKERMRLVRHRAPAHRASH